MEKPKTNGAKPFPLLIGAVFCEKVLEEKDGVLSAVRIVDVVQVPPLPSKAKKGVVWPNIWFLMMVRAGNFRGKGTWEIIMENPSGKRIKATQQEVEMTGGPESGFNIRVPAAFKWDKPGLYWFEVHFNKRRIGRSPLTIKIAEPPAAPAEKTKEEGKKSKG